MIANQLQHFLEFEVGYLLEALRRDIRAESLKKETDPENSFEHGLNMRRSLRLLELLAVQSMATNTSLDWCVYPLPPSAAGACPNRGCSERACAA
jgi:hypothetical protein